VQPAITGANSNDDADGVGDGDDGWGGNDDDAFLYFSLVCLFPLYTQWLH